MRLTAIFKKAPRYFWIACCVSLAIVGALLVYTLTSKPNAPPALTDVASTADSYTPLPDGAALPDVESVPDVSGAPIKHHQEDYWSTVVSEGAYAGMAYAEVNAQIDRDMEELEADIERSLAWYAEIEKDSARIKEILARSKAENDAVLKDHPATTLLQHLIKEGYTDEEIFRNPEFKRIMNEYFGAVRRRNRGVTAQPRPVHEIPDERLKHKFLYT